MAARTMEIHLTLPAMAPASELAGEPNGQKIASITGLAEALILLGSSTCL